MSKVFVSAFTQSRLLREFEQTLSKVCPREVADVRFVQQSHNATVFQGMIDGQPAFFKWYEPQVAEKIVTKSVAEIESVTRRMTGCVGGAAPLIWASARDGIIVIGTVSGEPVIDVLGRSDMPHVLSQVGRWLQDYVGDTVYEDQYSTSYWMRIRNAVDLEPLSKRERDIAGELRGMQADLAQKLGTVPTLKGHVPRDFTPWNLHWTGCAIWAFDMEGHVRISLALSLARFSVLSTEQADLFNGDGVQWPLESLVQTLDNDYDDEHLVPFVYGDILFERYVKWSGHSIKGPRLERAITHFMETT